MDKERIQSVNVRLGARTYPIHIGPGLLPRLSAYIQALAPPCVLIVSDENVAPLYLDIVTQAFDEGSCIYEILPAGEQHKTLDSFERIIARLLQARYGRDTLLLALGGGVVGDITGFAAACYQRGIAFMQVPTTLLAQVDSSVGGKTSVNHALSKNMIGAFHQPSMVLIDTDTLITLPERDLIAGLAEVIKYGILGDALFFSWLEQNIDSLRAGDHKALTYAIRRSCENKARVVSMDEYEQQQTGGRVLLNLGHTFAHAIEVELGYGCWRHGEAVSVGLLLAARLSHREGCLAAGDVERIRKLLERAGLPLQLPANLSVANLCAHMAVDKKVRAGQMRLVLPRAIGKAELTSEFHVGNLELVLAEALTARSDVTPA